MLVISHSTLNKVRADNAEFNSKIKALISNITENGMPMCDYVCLRKKAKMSALLDRDEFPARQVFLDAYEKWRKIFKHSRKKDFKFSNLLKFIKSSQ